MTISTDDAVAGSRAVFRDAAETFAELSPSLFAIRRVGGMFLYVNAAWTRVLGWTPAELLRRPFIEFVHPDDREATRTYVGGVGRGLEAAPFSNRYLHIDGSARRLSWTASLDAAAQVVYSVATDVTEAARSEGDRRDLIAELEQRSRQTRLLVECAPRLAQEPTFEAAASVVANAVRTGLATSHAGVYLATDGDLRLVAGCGWHAEDIGARDAAEAGRTQVRATFLSLTPATPADVSAVVRSPLLERNGIRTSATAPIVDGRAIGVVSADDTSTRAFTLDDVAFLQACAATLAAEHRRRADAAALADASRCTAPAHERERRVLALVEGGTWDERIVTKHVTFSPEFAALLDYDAERDGDARDVLYGAIASGDRAAFHALLQSAREGRTTNARRIDVRATTCNGVARHLRLSAERSRATDGEPILVGAAVDISEIALQREALRFAQDCDPNTGLHTRKRFDELLDAALTNGGTVAVIAIELASLSTLDEALGHAAADQLVRTIADRIAHTLGSGTVVARSATTDVLLFALIGTDDAPMTIAETLRDWVLREPFVFDGRSDAIGWQMGISAAPRDGTTAETLVHDAGLAMRASRADGRNRISAYEPTMLTALVVRSAMKSDLRRALENDELFLHYQPIVDARNGAIVALEALVRWRHPQTGIIGPGEFIPIAEATGDIIPLSRWIFAEAMKACRAWQRCARDIVRVSVNVSAAHLAHPDFLGHLGAALREAALPARYLAIEVTESVLVGDVARAARTLAEVRSTGATTSLDDFGTGDSSLAYLERLPFDTIKIDRAFVNEIAESDADRVLVDTIVTVAKKLDLAVTAEGVETREQQRILRALGCDHMQGYLFARPLDASAVRDLLLARMLDTNGTDAVGIGNISRAG
jgi:diguanylate cyclase (GGDEF)-like protein/PAS domain S-box-containing protein